MQKSPNNLLLKEDERKKLFEYLELKFGVPTNILEKFLYIKRGDSIWICSQEIDIAFLKLVDFERVGLRCCRWAVEGLFKPTTYFLQYMGEHISKNRVEMTSAELVQYIQRAPFPTKQTCEAGYICVSYNQQVIGCARFKEGEVFSEFPKKIFNNMKLSQLKDDHV